MGTVLASTTQADSTTTTTAAFPFGTGDVITTQCAIPLASPPAQPNQVVLQASVDNANWFNIDRRTYGLVPGVTYQQAFRLSDYSGINGYTPQSQYGLVGPWVYYRLLFGGNTGGAVTISAMTSSTLARAVVPLTATTATTGGAVGSWVPPEGGAVVVNHVQIVVSTGSTGAANVNAGIAANTTTSNSSLIAAASVHTSGSVLDSNTTTSGVGQYMAAGKAVTFTGSADTTGMIATAYIDYLLP